MPKPPNILVVTTDQQHADCIGALGRPDVRTPNLDRMARQGVVFTRCYSANPECVASRLSVLTGQYPHTHGVYNGGKAPIPEDYLALPQYLADALGYRTGLTGKKHFGHWRRPAFDRDTGDDLEGYHSHLKSQGLWETYSAELDSAKPAFSSYDTAIPYEHSEPVWTATRTIEMIDALAGDRPFFISANFDNPHPPTRVPSDAPVRYDPEALDLGQVRRCSPEDRRLLRLRPSSSRLGGENVWNAEVHGEGVFRAALARYYGMVSMVDDNMGRIMRHLESRRLLDDTLVIFTADHGDFAGEYGMIGKNPRGHFEALMRVPLIFYWRGRFGPERIHSLVQNTDLFPTLCGLLGLDVPCTVQGTSFADALRFSGSGGGPGPATGEIAFCDSLHCKTVLTRRYRLSYHYDGEEHGELFDRQGDPEERVNLFDDPRHRHTQECLMRELVRWWMRTDQPRSWSVFESLNPGAEFRYLRESPGVAERSVPKGGRGGVWETWAEGEELG